MTASSNDSRRVDGDKHMPVDSPSAGLTHHCLVRETIELKAPVRFREKPKSINRLNNIDVLSTGIFLLFVYLAKRTRRVPRNNCGSGNLSDCSTAAKEEKAWTHQLGLNI